jgi:hypothetical protein
MPYPCLCTYWMFWIYCFRFTPIDSLYKRNRISLVDLATFVGFWFRELNSRQPCPSDATVVNRVIHAAYPFGGALVTVSWIDEALDPFAVFPFKCACAAFCFLSLAFTACNIVEVVLEVLPFFPLSKIQRIKSATVLKCSSKQSGGRLATSDITALWSSSRT